jgi:hypothetical protein
VAALVARGEVARMRGGMCCSGEVGLASKVMGFSPLRGLLPILQGCQALHSTTRGRREKRAKPIVSRVFG